MVVTCTTSWSPLSTIPALCSEGQVGGQEGRSGLGEREEGWRGGRNGEEGGSG